MVYKHTDDYLLATIAKQVFEVGPRILEISLVKPKNNRKQASLERIPKFLGKPLKVACDYSYKLVIITKRC